MRAFAFVLVLSLSLGLCPSAEASPRRVASLNMCTDELLLTLADPRQILSVNYLSHLPQETPLWKVARRYRKNDRSLLSIAGLKPDLVLTMGGGAQDRVRIAQRLGIRILDLPYPQRLSDMEASIRQVGEALGRQDASRRVLAQIQTLKRQAPLRTIDTVWLGGGGRSVPARGLDADWMRLAGLRQRPLTGDRISLEQLLAAPPAILLRSNYRQGQYSGEQRWLSHPLARNVRRSRTITTDGRLWTCKGPSLIAEIARVRAEVAR